MLYRATVIVVSPALKGVLNVANRKLEFQDEINNRLILTALTLCTGQWGNQYKDINVLYFGTRRCSTIRLPTPQNPDKQKLRFAHF